MCPDFSLNCCTRKSKHNKNAAGFELGCVDWIIRVDEPIQEQHFFILKN